jgi:hypothetical protein
MSDGGAGSGGTNYGYPRSVLEDRQALGAGETEGKLYKGRLYIKTTGQPYPMKLEKTGRETGHAAFTRSNRIPAPTSPASTVTIGG